MFLNNVTKCNHTNYMNDDMNDDILDVFLYIMIILAIICCCIYCVKDIYIFNNNILN